MTVKEVNSSVVDRGTLGKNLQTKSCNGAADLQ